MNEIVILNFTFQHFVAENQLFWSRFFSAIRLCFEVSYFMVWTGYWTVDYCNEILKIIDFINLRINISYSNQSRPKNSKLQNIIWSPKKIWIKTIDSRQRTTKTIDFIDLHINILNSNQYRLKNTKLQNIIWSPKKIWIQNIISRWQTVQ